ncbi:uncharacterized protein LOC134706512 [Mytilus trossulus]|uniref:uncharacterized protein LOC134706512 n=1 Tax=Mytilus trossulus TaxID=6551 RepID=UPI00300788B8
MADEIDGSVNINESSTGDTHENNDLSNNANDGTSRVFDEGQETQVDGAQDDNKLPIVDEARDEQILSINDETRDDKPMSIVDEVKDNKTLPVVDEVKDNKILSVVENEDRDETSTINTSENTTDPGSIEHKSKRRKSKHTSKVSPVVTDETGKENKAPILQDSLQNNETLEVQKNQILEDSRGSELLFAVKNRKKQAALKLIDNGADIHFLDQTKCNVIHYAALAGYDDLILKLISQGASVKIWDCNGETALHKAARTGHESTVVTLVSKGADVYALNWQGNNPLELAVRGKHIKVIEALCLFGADLVMQDWQWLEEAITSRNKEDQAIVEIFKKQSNRLAGYKHGGIIFGVKYIEPEKDTKMKKIGATLMSKTIQRLPYFFYCCKLPVEYTNVQKYISEDNELFSDIYECKAWGSSNTAFTLEIKLTGLPKCNETLKAVSPNGHIANIESSIRNEEKNNTYVTVAVNIKAGTVVSFMFVTVEKPEVFSITEQAVTIQPQMEPDAEIDIPKDTFDSPGDLLFNVVETKDVNTEDADSMEEAVLVTNVIDLSMSNHQQPKQPIDMKLPMHSTLNEDTEIVILTSSKEFPDEIEDWEIETAQKDSRRRSANFKIRHFSIFTGVTKKKVDSDMIGVCMLIQKALNNERQVEFFAVVKTLSRDEYAIVIECALQRKAKKRKKHWERKQYEMQEVEGISHTVKVNQWFRVKFDGNIKRIGTDQSDTQKLMFHPNRDNYQIFSTEMVDKSNPPIGRIKIELIEETGQEPIRVVESKGCLNNKETLIPRDPITTYMNLTSLPVHLRPPPANDIDEPPIAGHQPVDIECTIKVLKITSLMQLAKKLNMDEAHQLAIQLKVSPSEVANLASDLPKTDDFLDAVFWKWRGRRPYESQVNFLVAALERTGMDIEAEEVKVAHKELREICFSW